MKILISLLLVTLSPTTWAADSTFFCGGLTALEKRSDALTQLIYVQNYPKHEEFASDGVAEPKNWFDTHAQVFHYYRAITVKNLPVATYELNYSLKGAGCILESVRAL